ncbi:MAG TPA: hypothetical protein VKU02_18420 [Gemmataceae bacterium]|nr:hypothetical protein [Gemmataceae bacterium]
MSATQKYAWFNLAVIAGTLVVIVVLLPFLGKGALGGCGFLGLIGFGVLFFRKQPGKILTDERDRVIQLRSIILAYAVFWIVFVLAAALVSPWIYGQDGTIPVWVVQMSVFGGFMLVNAVMSIAILVQYAGGSSDAE